MAASKARSAEKQAPKQLAGQRSRWLNLAAITAQFLTATDTWGSWVSETLGVRNPGCPKPLGIMGVRNPAETHGQLVAPAEFRVQARAAATADSRRGPDPRSVGRALAGFPMWISMAKAKVIPPRVGFNQDGYHFGRPVWTTLPESIVVDPNALRFVLRAFGSTTMCLPVSRVAPTRLKYWYPREVLPTSTVT